MNKYLKNNQIILNPIERKRRKIGSFWGNLFRTGVEKLNTSADNRIYIHAGKKHLLDFYRLDLIRLLLDDKKITRSYLIGEAIHTFVIYFEDLLVRMKEPMPNLRMIVDLAMGRGDFREYTEYKNYIETEQNLINLLKKEPYYARRDYRFFNFAEDNEIWMEMFAHLLEVANDVNKNKKVDKSKLTYINLIKRMMVWLESNLKEE